MINDKIKQMVESPHPVYSKNLEFWKFLLNSFEGGQDYIGVAYVDQIKVKASGEAVDLLLTTHLFQHEKEKQESFKKRVKMAYYFNFCAPIIDIYTNHLFKKPIIEDWKSIAKSVDYRKENIDRRDSSIYEFRKEIAELSQVFGHAFVITDKPEAPVMVRSRQDEIDNDLFPYFSVFYPTDIINWSLDIFGSPYWVLVRESRDGNQDPMQFDKEIKNQLQYRLWTRGDWFLFNAKYEPIAAGQHGLGHVPITCFINKKSKKERAFLGISRIADISFVARDVFNACSELRQILRDQTFAILTMQGTADEYDEIKVGTSKGLLYPVDRDRPGYISPEAANAEVMFKHIDRQISTMFRLAKLEGGSAKPQDQSAQTQSGVSKAWDFNETNQALSDLADNMQDGESKLWRTFAQWEGKEFDGHVIYPKEFSVQSLNEDLDEAEKELKLNLGQTFNIEVKKAIIKKKFPRIDELTLQSMIDELETVETKAEGGRLLDRLGVGKPVATPTQAAKKEE